MNGSVIDVWMNRKQNYEGVPYCEVKLYRSNLNEFLTGFASGFTLGLKNAINGKDVKEIHLKGLDNEGCGIVNNSWELDMRNP